MIAKSSATGQSKRAKHFKEKDYAIGKNKVFYAGGPGSDWKRGLYAFVSGKIRCVWVFHDHPIKAGKNIGDWHRHVVDKVEVKFTDNYIWEKYIAPMINALFWK